MNIIYLCRTEASFVKGLSIEKSELYWDVVVGFDRSIIGLDCLPRLKD